MIRTPEWKRPRKCRFCPCVFTPKRPQDVRAEFCCPEHRKAFHKQGGPAPYKKLLEKIKRDLLANTDMGDILKNRAARLEKRVLALEKRLDELTGPVEAPGAIDMPATTTEVQA